MGLNVPFQISCWLMSQSGYKKYEKNYGDDYFLFFNSILPTDLTLTTLYDSFSYLKNRILNGAPKDKRYTWALKKKKAGAIYTYAVPEIQDPKNIAVLESNMLSEIEKWCTANGAKMGAPTYPRQPADQIMVVEVDITPASI
jgi:hypothetical protein